jgi:hypothetical protein
MPLIVVNTAMSARRAAVEVTLAVSCITVAVWVSPLLPGPWFRAVLVGAAVAFPALCIIRGQAAFPEFAWHSPALAASARLVFLYTLAATALLLGARYLIRIGHYDLPVDAEWAGRFVEYLGWAFLQQIGLQTFLTRRMQLLFQSPWLVSCAAAFAFSLIHLPNPVLVVLTFVAGIFWSWSFQRVPNLYVLAVSHAWLAVVTIYCLPRAWHHALRIGPSYWQY